MTKPTMTADREPQKTENRWSVTLRPGESQVSRFDGIKVVNKSNHQTISVVVVTPIKPLTNHIRTTDDECPPK